MKCLQEEGILYVKKKTYNGWILEFYNNGLYIDCLMF